MRTLNQQLQHDLNEGLTEAQVAEKHDLPISMIRVLLNHVRQEERATQIRRARELATTGHNISEISSLLQITESEVRILLKGE